MDGAVGMNEMGWVEYVNCNKKKAEVEALKTRGKKSKLWEPFSSQLPIALCQTLWSPALGMCFLVSSRGSGTLVCIWELSFCVAPSSAPQLLAFQPS